MPLEDEGVVAPSLHPLADVQDLADLRAPCVYLGQDRPNVYGPEIPGSRPEFRALDVNRSHNCRIP